MNNDTIKLHSISFLLDEPSLFKGPSIASLLPFNPLPYKMMALSKNQEMHSSYLPFMPEVFQRRLMAYSKEEFNTVNEMYRLVEMLRYNFSDGTQVSTKEILRHSNHRFVPDDFLPQLISTSLNFDHRSLSVWPLIQKEAPQSVRPIEEIMQALISRIILAHRQKKIVLNLQTHAQSTKSQRLENIEFEPAIEFDWRVDFVETPELKSHFKLISKRKVPFYFFDSFAYDPTSGLLVIHPWFNEIKYLQENLSKISDDLLVENSSGLPAFEIRNESKTKVALKYIRSRLLPVTIVGQTHRVPADKSQTEIHFSEKGHFYIQQDARLQGAKNLVRKGWSDRSVYYLAALSHGLPYAMNTAARDIASHDEFNRHWDLGLLRHLGILQYVFWQVLAVRFQGHLSDGSSVEKSAVFGALDEKIKIVLTQNQPDYQAAKLSDLCSKSTLACFEKFVSRVFLDLEEDEFYYSEDGEAVLGGVIEREFRLLHEILARLAATSGGSCFNKNRVPLLSRLSSGPWPNDRAISGADYFLEEKSLSSALEMAQYLVPFGFKLFLNNRPLQELGDGDLKANFILNNKLNQSQINWFELSPQFFLMGQSVDADQFLKLGVGGVVEYENKLFLVPKSQMPSLRLLEQFWKKLQKGKDDSARKKRNETIYKLPRSQTLFLLALRNLGIPFKGDEGWNELCSFYDSLSGPSPMIRLPKTIKAELKPYQIQGVRWLNDLYRLRLGALLADDMGLGKTLQTLAFLENLRFEGDMGTVLIVVPSSLVYNWCNEIEKFTPDLPVRVFKGENRQAIASSLDKEKSGLVIVTYGLLLVHLDFLSNHPWNIAVFDEAQNLKNISSKRTSAARALKANFKIALTGTPMENHFGEFYSLIDILVPGSLGPIENFRSLYVNTPAVDYETIKELKLKVKPLVLRRTKNEILNQLPQKQENSVRITFEKQQKEIYRNVALSYNQRVQEAMAVQGAASVQLQMFTALLRLRQVCSDPTGMPDIDYQKTPPKLELLASSLKEIVESGESALVFTQFLQTLEHIERLLGDTALTVFVIHGGVNLSKRQKILTQFNSMPGAAVLLMTLKTGGVGLNLTKASYVFHLEPWWNPAVENQATDRAHRIGQTKAVQVFKYIMHESLEEKIEVLKERKDRKFQSLFFQSFSDNTDPMAAIDDSKQILSKDDFDRLIGI